MQWAQVLLETDLTDVEEEDELLQAFSDEELHQDFAHSIALGYHQQLYHLLFVAGGQNFMWATPTATRMEPEELLNEFLGTTGIKVGQLRIDNEFFCSTAFKAYCKKKGITLCPSVAYTHTMQARAEGAVRICKEHVRCLLKASNMPPRFWPFALLHFCRVYNSGRVLHHHHSGNL
eukprot:3254288-Rhodomonas_salina.1